MTSDNPSDNNDKGIDLAEIEGFEVLDVNDPSIAFSNQPVLLQDSQPAIPKPPEFPPQAPAEQDPSKTKIDLGEDLLEDKTVVMTGVSTIPEDPSDPRQLEASIQNARILLSEGFPEEAKKILRQILLQNKNNVESQKLLEEIHHSELKQIFTVNEPNTRKNYMTDRRAYDDSILNVDAEKLLKSLDEEFDLGLDPSRGGMVFVAKELEDAAPAPSDRIDLAISFIEMELYAHANQLLRAVLRTENPSTLTAVSLLGRSHLLSGQYFEVISVLQPYLNDTEIVKEDKIEFFYLIGRANQALHRHQEALSWYLHVEGVDATYRDTAERLKQLKK